MKLSNSSRMKLAHIFAQQNKWTIRFKASRMVMGKKAPEIKTYNDLVSYALRKEVMAQIVEKLTFDLVSLQTDIQRTQYILSHEIQDLFSREFKYCKQSQLIRIRRQYEEMEIAEAKFNILYPMQVELCGESTEEDKAKLLSSTPRNERWDSFYFTVANALNTGHKATTILEVLKEQYEYIKPCCCCGNEFGCDCGCTCEEYGESCDCGDDDYDY